MSFTCVRAIPLQFILATSSSSNGNGPGTSTTNNQRLSLFAPSTVTVVLLSVIIVQNAWSSAPRWLKLVVSRIGRRLSQDGDRSNNSRDRDGDGIDDIVNDANDDLSDPTKLYEKLSHMSELAKELLSDVSDSDEENEQDNNTSKSIQQKRQHYSSAFLPWYKYYTCCMSLFHLQKELDHTHPEYRHNLFNKQGEELHPNEIKTLLYYLDFA